LTVIDTVIANIVRGDKAVDRDIIGNTRKERIESLTKILKDQKSSCELRTLHRVNKCRKDGNFNEPG